jgi:tetratricopeptide (TPR) repeat protein
MLGLAYAEASLVSASQFHESEALRLLTAALNARERTDAVGAGDAEFFARLGFLHQQRGALPQAARAYEISLQVEPHRTDALVNLGGIYAAQGRIEEAEKLWREALGQNAGLTEAAVNLARVYRSEGKLPQARGLLQRAIRFDPDSGQVRQLLKEIDSYTDIPRR